MARIKLLSARQVETLPPGFHADGGNLYLRVRDSGSRSWVFRYKQAGRVIELGLGPTEDRDLKSARGLVNIAMGMGPPRVGSRAARERSYAHRSGPLYRAG